MNDTPITFRSHDLTLHGSLRAGSEGAQPAALLISGSGPIDRDSDMKRLQIGVMGRLAGHLAAHGFASLRFDKRGVGESEGEYRSAGFHDNVADARAALAALRSRPEIDPDRIFVIGHSEGALIAMALADDARLAGTVLLAGAAQTGENVLAWQAGRVAETLPRPVRALLRLLRQDIVRTQTKRLERIRVSTDDVSRIQGVRLNAKWFREFMAFDPATALRRVAVPTLAITGAKDIQVDPADVQRMSESVSAPFTGEVVDDVTHLLRADEGPATVRTYKKQARQPLDARVLELVVDWMLDPCLAEPESISGARE